MTQFSIAARLNFFSNQRQELLHKSYFTTVTLPPSLGIAVLSSPQAFLSLLNFRSWISATPTSTSPASPTPTSATCNSRSATRCRKSSCKSVRFPNSFLEKKISVYPEYNLLPSKLSYAMSTSDLPHIIFTSHFRRMLSLIFSFLADRRWGFLVAAIHNLTDTCWTKCITGGISGGKLSSKEETCTQNCVERFLDANTAVLKHLEQMRGEIS